MGIEKIKKEVFRLTRSEQIELIHFVIDLLSTDDFELSDEWKKEIDRRVDALIRGTSIGRPARDVISKYKSK